MKDFLIIIPAYNEQERIGAVLDGLTVRSALHDDQLPALEALADAIAASLREEA